MTRCLGVLALVLWAAVARAEPADYLAWKARFTRAASAEARRAEVEAAPAFGRIWLHGYVYDLATPGIPDAEKARVRAAAEDVAAVLAARGEDEPRLLLDRADTGELASVADAVRAGADRVIAAMRSGQAPEVAVFEAGDSLVAAAAAYALLERAHIARRALGGEAEAALVADGARAAAVVWMGLAGSGQAVEAAAACAGLPGREPPLARLKLRMAADALVAGEAARAWFEAEGARRLASGPGDAPLALAALGVMAEASARSGQAARARMELDALATSLRGGGAAWAAARVEARRLALEEAPAALAVEAVRVAELPAGRADHEVVGALAVAAQRLRAAGSGRVAADEPAAAIPLLDAAATLFGFLSTSTVLQRATPSAARAEIALERARAQAEVELSRARLAERAGLLDEALAAARRAVAVTPVGEQAPAQALVGRLALALGGFGEADASTAAADAGLAGAAAVENRLIRARLRLAEGRWAAAFGHANRGLRALRRAGVDDRRLRAALHHVAALALDADGQAAAAGERLAFALGVHPDAAVALDLAALRLEAGDAAGAEAALAGVDDPGTRAARGCLRAAAGDEAGAKAVTAGVAGGEAGQVAALCRAAARWQAGDAATARALAPMLGPADDPRLRFAAAALRGDLVGIAEHWRAARGFGATRLDRRRALAPVDPEGWVAAAGLGGDVAGLALAVWWAEAREAPRTAPPVVPVELRALLAEVEGRAAAAAQRTAEAAAVERLIAARARWAAALAALDAAQPVWARSARPAPPSVEALAPASGLRLFLQTGPARSQGWLWAAGGVPARWELPGRAALPAVVAPLAEALASAAPWPADVGDERDPNATQWQALARLAATLAPPLRGAPVERLEVWADGPLAGLALDALVLDLPARPGLAPRFVASGRAVVHRGSADPLPAAAGGAVAVVALAIPVEAALDALDPRAAQAAGGPETVGSRPVWWLDDAAAPAGRAAVVVGAGAGPSVEALRGLGAGRLIRGAGQVPPEVAARLLARLLGRPPVMALRFLPPTGGQAAALAPAVVLGAGAPLDADAALAGLRAAAFAAAPRRGEVPAFHPSRWARLSGFAP